jgi:hypothetical protein
LPAIPTVSRNRAKLDLKAVRVSAQRGFTDGDDLPNRYLTAL